MANTSVSKYEICVGTEECDFSCDKNGEIRNEQELVEASVAGNFDKIVDLLMQGVSIDAEEYNKVLFYASKNYMTPLQLAAANGHIKCVQILIDHGADVNAKDRFDVTALHMAAEEGHYLCLKALLDAGAKPSLPTKFSKSECYRAVPHLGGTTPLHLAALSNHVECVRELIQYGADYNAIDECGHTSLYIAAHCGFSKCVLTHLKNSVARDILSLPGFDTNDTPLHFAVCHRMIDCVQELLCLGSDVNYLNNVGHSPLHVALTYSENDTLNMKILKLLILEGYNTDINLCDSGCYTPLHYVCFTEKSRRWLRRPAIAKFLISYGANVNIRNCHKTSLLKIELKCIEKDYDVLKYIVRSMLRLPPLQELTLETYLSKKMVWYEQLASNPRTLLHCCRYVIRQSLGSFRLRHIKNLPIPAALQSYMLLEYD